MLNIHDLYSRSLNPYIQAAPNAPREAEGRGTASPARPDKPIDNFLGAQPPKETEKKKKKDNFAWFLHKMIKQAIWRPAFAVAWVPRSLQMYRTYFARYSANPNEDIFRGDPASRIYDRNTKVGRRFQRLAPEQYRNRNLTSDDHDALRASGARHGKTAARIMTWANYARITGNIGALYSNIFGDGGSKTEAVIIGTDTAICASFIGVQKFYGAGFNNIGLAQKIVDSAGPSAAARASAANDALAKQQRAYKLFRIGKIISYSAFALQTTGAGIKLYNELQKGKNARLSVIVDSAVDIGQGGAYSVYNYYLVRESMKVLKGAQVAGDTAAKVGFVKKATDVLSVSARVIPRPLLWTMRSLGVVGSAIAAVPSGMSLYRGITDDAIPTAKRRHMIISGSLGIMSSAAFAIGAFFITPAGLAIGTIAILIGLSILGIQTIYDEWHNIKRFGRAIGSWIGNAARRAWHSCANGVSNIKNSIATTFSTNPVTVAKNFTSSCVSFAKRIGSGVVNGAVSVAKKIGGGIKRGWNYLFG